MRNIGSNPTSFETILSNLATNKPAVKFKANGGDVNSVLLDASIASPETIYFTKEGIVMAGYVVGETFSNTQKNVIDHLGNIVTVDTSNNSTPATTDTGFVFSGTNVTIKANETDGEIHLVAADNVFIGAGSQSNNVVATQGWVTTAINNAASQGMYQLPTAANGTKGGIQVDGTTFTVGSNEKIALTGYSVTGSSSSTAITVRAGGTLTLGANNVYLDGQNVYLGNSATASKKVATIGASTDASTATTIYGAKKYAESLVLKWS